jgi:glycerol-3-phosphate acyltransferase PlsY
MNSLLILIISVVGYLVGSISFTRIIGKIVIPNIDLERSTVKVEGTNEFFTFRSVSATTIRAQAGAKYGIIASVLDALKALIPIIIVSNLLNSEIYSFILSIAIIFGHDFPIYHRFKGGRGVSCLIGSLIVFDWPSIPITLVSSLLIGLFLIDDAFFAYLSMPAYLIPWTILASGGIDFISYSLIINAIYWGALTPEIREYQKFRRTEGYKKAKKARHERTKKKISKFFAKIGFKKEKI